MRVLWVSHLLPFPPQGGARQRSFGLLRGLARDAEVTFASFNQVDFCGPEEVEEARRGLSEHVDVAFVESIPSDRRFRGKQRLALKSLFTRRPYTINWLQSPAFARRLRAVVADVRPDLVHFDTISLAPYRRLVGPVPATLNHHNVETHMLFRRSEKTANPIVSAYFRQEARRLERYQREVAAEFDLHLVCSPEDGERLRSSAPDARIEVVPNGVDIGYFHPLEPAPSKTPKSLIFVGGLSWYPNVSAVQFLTQRVWPRIPDDDARLTIVGRSPPEWLRAIPESDSRVKVTGWVDDVRPVVSASTVFVCPIFDGGGTKLKVLDALAMGVPLVAHPIACEGIAVEDGENVLLAETEEDFVRQIRRLWEEPELGPCLAERGVELIRSKYSFDAIGKRLTSHYAELVTSAHGSQART